MTSSTRKPGADEAHRLPRSFCLAAERPENIPLVVFLQVRAIASRFGLASSTARALAPLVFGEAQR
jgi:hypothetical protein